MPPPPIILKGQAKLLEPIITMLMAIYQILEAKDIGHIYGIPVEEYDRQHVYRPQVTLHFSQNPLETTGGTRPISGQVSFRLMNETSKSITVATVQALATKIKQVFGVGTPYKWSKGKELVNYYDLANGYYLKILCRNKTDGKDLITKILSIQSHTYEAKYLKLEKDEDELSNYPDIPPKINILGDAIQEPRKRPIADVRFTHAEVAIWAKGKPVVLVDLTGRYPSALVK